MLLLLLLLVLLMLLFAVAIVVVGGSIPQILLARTSKDRATQLRTDRSSTDHLQIIPTVPSSTYFKAKAYSRSCMIQPRLPGGDPHISHRLLGCLSWVGICTKQILHNQQAKNCCRPSIDYRLSEMRTKLTCSRRLHRSYNPNSNSQLRSPA